MEKLRAPYVQDGGHPNEGSQLHISLDAEKQNHIPSKNCKGLKNDTIITDAGTGRTIRRNRR